MTAMSAAALPQSLANAPLEVVQAMALPSILLSDVAEPKAMSMAFPPLEDLMASLNQMRMMDVKKAPPTAVNPCAEDMRRLKCTDSACLKAAAETLSINCAEFVLTRALPPFVLEPSPSPAPRPQFKIDIISEDSNGVVHKVSGRNAVPPEMKLLLNFLPAEIANVFRPKAHAPRPRYPTASIGGISFHEDQDTENKHPSASIGGISLWTEDEDMEKIVPGKDIGRIASIGGGGGSFTKEDETTDTRKADEPSTHPCASEILACKSYSDETSSDYVRTCLLSNFERLSSKCKCFVHQVEGEDAIQRALPIAVKAADIPRLNSITIIDAPDGPIVRHGAPCFLTIAVILILFSIVLRRIIFCCTAARRPRFAVVVPPEQAVIKTIEPLNAADIKTIVAVKA
jgi:hypothetical protein